MAKSKPVYKWRALLFPLKEKVLEVADITIPYGRSDVFKLYPIGDTHLGTQHCNEDMLKAKIKEVASNKYARWVGIGDYGEFISPNDKRWDGKCISMWVDKDDIAESQVDYISRLFRPIASQCIGMLEGNHENMFRVHSHADPQKNICKRLEAANLGATSFINLHFRRSNADCRLIRVVAAHGAGCAITPGAKLTRLQRFMNQYAARIYMHGHVHDIITHTIPYLDVSDAGRIVSRDKVGAMTGCFFTTYTQGIAPSYGEWKNYPPTSLGCPVFTIVPDKDIVRVEG
ncbi:hypothetical protein [Dehalococcoides mccartyi]|uniref:hypothetical protein n=1 Tax=Dehalococcoides mccartyi TaxID=61435 RepID=UPI0007504740|nr:hypothetical protein [Dehalococcoides mccartyi]